LEKAGSEKMFEDKIKHHDELFFGPSYEVGKIHWYILKADTEMDRICWVKGEKRTGLPEKTEFGKEAMPDEIHWWVFKKEKDVQELLRRTQSTLKSVQKIKEDSLLLKERFYPESYINLIKKLKEFTELHSEEIRDLYNYVTWLHQKDVLAPRILFTYRVWGSTRLSERILKITANNIDEDRLMVKRCTEIALGLRLRIGNTLEYVYLDILHDIYESTDPEYQGPISVPNQRLLVQSSHKILDEFATYFEFLRQSLRNIILEIMRYNAHTQLLNRESFWRSFITKVMSQNKLETQLWDFKTSLEMWHRRHREKEEAKFRFCEQIAAFANTDGGVLIVGISDKPPRKIVGVKDLENKIKFTKQTIQGHINYDTDFTNFQQIVIKDENGKEKRCLKIAIAQTKDVIGVRDKSGKFSYSIRLETGLDRSDYDKIKYSKTNTSNDNYNFLIYLEDFLYDR